MSKIEVGIARPLDSRALITFLNQVGKESHFLTMDEAGILMTESEMAHFLVQQAQTLNRVYFIARINDEIAGVIQVSADFHYRIRHIGELFVAVGGNFQGQGVASVLFEHVLAWLKKNGIIKRLELTVQARNTGARHLYEKFGFQLESIRKWGARDEQGELIDVCEYVRFIQ